MNDGLGKLLATLQQWRWVCARKTFSHRLRQRQIKFTYEVDQSRASLHHRFQNLLTRVCFPLFSVFDKSVVERDVGIVEARLQMLRQRLFDWVHEADDLLVFNGNVNCPVVSDGWFDVLHAPSHRGLLFRKRQGVAIPLVREVAHVKRLAFFNAR